MIAKHAALEVEHLRGRRDEGHALTPEEAQRVADADALRARHAAIAEVWARTLGDTSMSGSRHAWDPGRMYDR